jgi:lipid-binding SYLF domain-containing protein
MKHSFVHKGAALGAVLAVALLGIARTSHAESDAGLIADAKHTIAVFKKADPGLDKFFQHAAGYAVFPGIGKGGLGIGGAHGDGVLFVGGVPIGRTSMTQVTVGAQIGAQEYAEIIFFETPAVLAQFKSGKSTFSAQVSAVALQSGASASAKYKEGVVVFTATKGGLMAEASVGGQKFKFEPF